MNNFNHHLIVFRTILRREVWRIFSIWPQSLLPPLVTASLYFVIFGQLIGGRIGAINGFTYLQFLAPGVTMLWIINAAYNNATGSLFLARFQRSIEEMLVAPISNRTILLGFVSGGVVRGVLVGLLVTIVAAFFTHIQIKHPGAALLVVLLATLLFSLVGFINGLFAKTFDDIMIITTFVLTPLTYLGGIFYSIKMLPPFWQKVSYFNPIFYIIDVFRYGMLGISDTNIYLALIFLLVTNILLFTLAMVLLNRGVGIRH